MALTALGAEQDLNRRLGFCAALADAPTALAWAMRECGLAAASSFLVTDAELVSVTAALTNKFEAYAEWKGLMMILINLDDESLAQIGVTEKAATVRPFIERRADGLYDQLKLRYGFGLSTTARFGTRLTR